MPPDIVVVQFLSRVWLFATPWTAAHQASLSFTVSWSLLKLMSTELVRPSNHPILCLCKFQISWSWFQILSQSSQATGFFLPLDSYIFPMTLVILYVVMTLYCTHLIFLNRKFLEVRVQTWYICAHTIYKALPRAHSEYTTDICPVNEFLAPGYLNSLFGETQPSLKSIQVNNKRQYIKEG